MTAYVMSMQSQCAARKDTHLAKAVQAGSFKVVDGATTRVHSVNYFSSIAEPDCLLHMTDETLQQSSHVMLFPVLS